MKGICGDPCGVATKARTLYEDFVKPMAEKEVNISGVTRRKIEEELELEEHISVNIFDLAQAQVYSLMHRQSYSRFLVSDLFKAVLQSTYSSDKAL